MISLEPKVFYIDLFCGAGGTSEGVHLANTNAQVVACVNHDATAIASHKLNHPKAKHFIEDVRNPEVVYFLNLRVKCLRKLYPNCKIVLWGSLECTNYSKAKGGLPRDADSRTLANHLFMYLEGFNPDYLYIENVVEFMAWGPLDENGRPVSRKNGTSFMKWKQRICDMGYRYDHRVLNSANFGAYTSRERYFGAFAKSGLPLRWPEATHTKNPDKSDGLFGDIKEKWLSVKDVLDLEDEGVSIFNREKPLSDNTLNRVYMGLEKFADTNFSDNRDYMVSYYGNGNAHGINDPCPTLTTKDRFAKINLQFIDQQYGTSKPMSLDRPANTLTANPKFNLVSVERKQFLYNPQFGDKGRSIDDPCFTLIARMDKKPPSMVSAIGGMSIIEVKGTDSEIMKKIKHFMIKNHIADIKMRMLNINELLRIQGFPEGYQMQGTKTQIKKFIGNSVVPLVAQKLVEANYEGILEHHELSMAA